MMTLGSKRNVLIGTNFKVKASPTVLYSTSLAACLDSLLKSCCNDTKSNEITYGILFMLSISRNFE